MVVFNAKSNFMSNKSNKPCTIFNIYWYCYQ